MVHACISDTVQLWHMSPTNVEVFLDESAIDLQYVFYILTKCLLVVFL